MYALSAHTLEFNAAAQVAPHGNFYSSQANYKK
jgi:hypothetical protein